VANGRYSQNLRGRIGIENSAVYDIVNLLLMVQLKPCNGTVCTVAQVSLHCGTLANHVDAVAHLESRGLLEIIEVSGTFCSTNRLDLLVSLDKRIPF
jgi:hypothetical protein